MNQLLIQIRKSGFPHTALAAGGDAHMARMYGWQMRAGGNQRSMSHFMRSHGPWLSASAVRARGAESSDREAYASDQPPIAAGARFLLLGPSARGALRQFPIRLLPL